ncbi:hypothetical protein ACE6JH_26350 [Streptomyces nigra]
MTASDQVVDLGRLPGGAVVTVHNRGGLSRATNFRWEINGAEGDLVVSAPVGHPQPSPLTLEGGRGTSTAHGVVRHRCIADAVMEAAPTAPLREVRGQASIQPYPSPESASGNARSGL